MRNGKITSAEGMKQRDRHERCGLGSKRMAKSVCFTDGNNQIKAILRFSTPGVPCSSLDTKVDSKCEDDIGFPDSSLKLEAIYPRMILEHGRIINLSEDYCNGTFWWDEPD
jgi:hypothetical protein